MKVAYEAADAIEAHMIRDLLKQEGVSADIHGEHLLGAMGDIPVAGAVRVMVDETDYARARSVVQRWDAAQPKEIPRPLHRPSRAWLWLLVGLLAGVSTTYAYFRSPVTVQGVDFNRDGLLDDKYTYSASGTLLRVERDRNFDHKVDYIDGYDQRGLIESSDSDDDFDGVFETHTKYRDGNPVHTTIDSDGDGYADVGIQYVDGVAISAEFLNPSTGLPLRVEHYKLSRLLYADVDTDKDGKLDTRYVYDRMHMVVSTERLPK